MYSEVPPGLEKLLKIGEGEVLRLKRGVYGLADAPKQWYQTLHKDLTNMNMTRSKMDP